MHWVRSNKCVGVRLALFALAVQIALSFGHVHFYALAFGALKSAPAATSQDPGAARLRETAPMPGSGGSAGIACAICALIQESAVSAPATPPTLPLPTDFGASALHPPPVLASAAAPHFLFQARGPPSI